MTRVWDMAGLYYTFFVGLLNFLVTDISELVSLRPALFEIQQSIMRISNFPVEFVALRNYPFTGQFLRMLMASPTIFMVKRWL